VESSREHPSTIERSRKGEEGRGERSAKREKKAIQRLERQNPPVSSNLVRHWAINISLLER